MEYRQKIEEIIQKVPNSLIDITIDREKGRCPTQASSNFITNREQGDWAEFLMQKAINNISKNYIAVKYGKSDDKVAGEEGFSQFFQEFQIELDTIGKRPDILIFRKSDYDLAKWGTDISKYSKDLLDPFVGKAVAGIEIRSSSFLVEKYDLAMQQRAVYYMDKALQAKQKILTEYADLLEHTSRRQYIEILNSINQTTLNAIDFRRPTWRSSERLKQLSEQFKILKNAIKEFQKRDFLSITPKVEDLKVIYKWIQTYNVPHYYFQVFFDKIYGISYQNILEVISNIENKGSKFFIEGDVKNQNKVTIKINVKEGIEIASNIDMPNHKSAMKELDRGRMLFYVKFESGSAYLNKENLLSLLKLEDEEF